MVKDLFFEDLAFSVSNFSSFEKGKEYFEDGLVEKIRKEGDVYTAAVRGNELYQVNLRFENEEIRYDCSCPYDFGGACKHVVAAILAFASDKKYAIPEIKSLLERCEPVEIKKFLEKILEQEPDKIEDLKIFLAGPKETSVAVSEYKNRFLTVLNSLNLREMLELWYREGEDYYDTDSVYGNFAAEDFLDETVSGFISEGQKYEENNNLAEAMKIYRAIHEALLKKQGDLKSGFIDLVDVFDNSKQEVVDCYLSVLSKTKNNNLRKIGISYLGRLFVKESVHEEQLLKGLKNIIAGSSEAKNLLNILNKSKKHNLSPTSSSLLAFLYRKTGNWEKFEELSLKNLKENPELILDLIEYYKKTGRKKDIIGKAREVLILLGKKQEDFSYSFTFISFKDLEVKIRYLLKDIYSFRDEYPDFIDNLEWIFLLTGSLKEYRELAKSYKEIKEKENFWQKMEKYFTKKYAVQNIFKVFKFESEKKRILKLVKDHHDADCFPGMIAFIQDEFPQECFLEYKKKIDSILEVADVRKYKEVAYHLTRMKLIGLETEFPNYVNFIKINYWRRRRLLEELKEYKLCGKI